VNDRSVDSSNDNDDSAPLNTRVSVVIPCFNSAKFLNESVASIVSQTVPVEEIIIVDDASTDDSFEVASGLSTKYSKVKITVHRNSCNQGPGRSRNTGITAATGDYVAFLDADDVWLPDKIERQLNFLRSKHIPAVVSEVIVTNETLKPFDVQDKSAYVGLDPEDLARAIYLGKITMSTPTLICERGVLLEFGGFDDKLRLREDHALLIKLSLGGKLAIHAEPVVKRRAHMGSYSSGVNPLIKFRHEIRFIQTFGANFDLATVTVARENVYRTMIDHCFLIGAKCWGLRFIRQLRRITGEPASKFIRYYVLVVLPGHSSQLLLRLRRNLKTVKGIIEPAYQT
jgi:glycosyltransferase involved in cell wall biosynthesis